MMVVNTAAYTNWEIPNAVTAKLISAFDPEAPSSSQYPPIIATITFTNQPHRVRYRHPKQLTDFATSAAPSTLALVDTSIRCKHRTTSGYDELSTKDARQ